VNDPRPAPPRGRRTLGVLLVAQAVAAVGLAAGGTAGGLLAEHVAGTAAVAALPLGLLVVGSGFLAPPTTALMKRRGRRAGLVAALVVACVGAGVVLAGAARANLALVLAGSMLLGAGNAAVMLARYAAADLGPPERLGRSVSAAMFAVTLGAVFGPNLLGPAAGLARALALPDAAGLYVVALGAFAAAALLLLFAVPPSPSPAAAGPWDAREAPGASASGTGASALVRETSPGARRMRLAPLAILAGANLTMVTVMAVAPVHLRLHGWGLEAIGVVIGVHIAAMYAPSPLSGWARDRFGSVAVAAVGAAMLAAVGVLGAFSGMTGVWASTLLLVLLGLGWNAQLVSGSALLAEQATPEGRHRAEGLGELGMGMAAAVGCLLAAGPLVASGGMGLLSAATVPVNVAMLGALLAMRLREHRRGGGVTPGSSAVGKRPDGLDRRGPEPKRHEAS
jgi:MFS family permease